MANIIDKLKNIQPVYRRSSNLMKLFVIGILIFAIVSLFVLRHEIRRMEDANAALESQAAQLEQENTELQENIDNLGSVQSVEQIAQDELGLIDPDTVLIQPAE